MLGIRKYRDIVIVLVPNLHLALVLSSTLLQFLDINVVRGDTLELLGSEPDTTLLFVEVLLGLDAELAEPLLDLLETVSLGASRQQQTIADKSLAFLFQDTQSLRVQLLGVSGAIGSIDDLEDILTHVLFHAEVGHKLVGLGRGLSQQLVVGGDVLVEGQDGPDGGGLILFEEERMEDVGKGGLLGRHLGDDLVHCALQSGIGPLHVGKNRVGRRIEDGRGLGRRPVLVRRHGAGRQRAIDTGELCGPVAEMADDGIEAWDSSLGSQCGGEKEDEEREEEEEEVSGGKGWTSRQLDVGWKLRLVVDGRCGRRQAGGLVVGRSASGENGEGAAACVMQNRQE